MAKKAPERLPTVYINYYDDGRTGDPFSQITDLRKHDKDGCDQLFPEVGLFCTERLWLEHGPTFSNSTRIWDMLWMCTTMGVESAYGRTFPLYVEHRGREMEVKLRLVSLGGDVCCFDLA